MSSVRSHDSARLRVAPADLVLKNWPLRDRKRVAWPLALGLTALAALTQAMTGRWEAGFAAAVVLVASTWRWWIPVTFLLGPAGVQERVLGRTTRRPWASFARYEILSEGVVLCPEADDSPAATIRGRYVAWLDRRDELLAVLDFYLVSRRTDSYSARSSQPPPASDRST